MKQQPVVTKELSPEMLTAREAAQRALNLKKKRAAAKSASANIARTGAKRGSFLS